MQETIIIKLTNNTKVDPYILKQLTTETDYQLTQIDDGKWFTYGMKQICPKIEEWSVQKLYLYKNFHKKIIRQLSAVKEFTCLCRIYLQRNSLEEVEGLTYLNLRNLSHLYLSHNNINGIRSFRKLNCFYLQTLQIEDNLIIENPEFFQYNNNYLKEIRIDCLGNELGWKWSNGQKMKWETKNLQNVGRAITYEKLNIGRGYMRPRVDFKEIVAVLSKKYKNIKVWAMK